MRETGKRRSVKFNGDSSDIVTPKRSAHLANGVANNRSPDEDDLQRATPGKGTTGQANEEYPSCSQRVHMTQSNRVFNDPVHGLIELEPLLVKIIDTPQFQRLRNIKQLGGCYFVFPGAAHNRFEHSLGVGHLAGQFLDQIQQNQPDLHITPSDILCVKIAGLCHDLGHGPFSHAFDGLFIPKARPGCKWKHEQASVQMFDHLVEENNLKKDFEDNGLTDNDMMFIKEMIAGPPSSQQDNEDWQYKGRTKEKCFLYEIVANKRTGIDVDKWDYFARDCHNLGIQNNFDYSRYMKFARVIDVENRHQICIRDKESNNMYDMFHTRNCLHRRAYQHKTSNIIEIMIIEAMLKADDHIRLRGTNGKQVKISESIDDMVAYTKLTDNIFYQILYSTDPALEKSRSILQAVQNRQLYKCIGQTIISNNRSYSQDEEGYIAREIALKSENRRMLTKADIIVQLVNFDYGMKDKNPIDALRFYAKSNPDQALKFRKDQISNLLPEMFAEQHLRVYCKKQDLRVIKLAESAFQSWCLGKECTTPKVGNLRPELTPMKNPDKTEQDHEQTDTFVGKLNFDQSVTPPPKRTKLE